MKECRIPQRLIVTGTLCPQECLDRALGFRIVATAKPVEVFGLRLLVLSSNEEVSLQPSAWITQPNAFPLHLSYCILLNFLEYLKPTPVASPIHKVEMGSISPWLQNGRSGHILVATGVLQPTTVRAGQRIVSCFARARPDLLKEFRGAEEVTKGRGCAVVSRLNEPSDMLRHEIHEHLAWIQAQERLDLAHSEPRPPSWVYEDEGEASGSLMHEIHDIVDVVLKATVACPDLNITDLGGELLKASVGYRVGLDEVASYLQWLVDSIKKVLSRLSQLGDGNRK